MSTPTPNTGNAILESLNRAQRRAVTSDASTVAILAGPGSGKTHTLACRVAWLIHCNGFRPADVVVATFTVKAARQIQERISNLLGKELGSKIVTGTFHSIARRYLASYGTRIGLESKFGIADESDSREILQDICRRLRLTIHPSHARSWISKAKAKGVALSPNRAKQEVPDSQAMRSCLDAYQSHLAQSNLLDYDDLLVRCVELLQNHPICVSNVQAVFIDEFQDTNGIQYDLMKLLANARQRITIVGDPDQSIYGWRSAEIRNLYRLLREFPETEEVSLEENYRSSQSILNLSLNLIQQDRKRYKKSLLPLHPSGARPVLRRLGSPAEEGQWIVSEIKRALAMFGGMLRHRDVAILLRSASLSRLVEAALGKAGVSYRMIGGHKFYDRKEIKILLDYLRVIDQPDNNDALARVINVPRRGIGQTTIKALLQECEQAKLSLWQLVSMHCRGERRARTKICAKVEIKLASGFVNIVSSLRALSRQHHMGESKLSLMVQLVEKLVDKLNFKEYLEGEFADDHEQRWANVQELISLACDFERDAGTLNAEDALPQIDGVEQATEDDLLGRFLSNIALASDAQKGEEHDEDKVVTLSTIHAAKGLEWPVVFIPSVYSGSIPHSRAEDVDEERRLLYVAMTRAQALLYLSYPLRGSQWASNEVEVSPFLSSFTNMFAPKGPSFDRSLVEGTAMILGRKPPSEKVIFGSLTPMFSPEDDLFPLDPSDPKTLDGGRVDAAGQKARTLKRSRTHDFADGGDHCDAGQLWQKPASARPTQRSRSFEGTDSPCLPGFVSAGAHQSVLEAETLSNASKVEPASAPRARWGSTRRRPDQKSILGFITQGPKTSHAMAASSITAGDSLSSVPASAMASSSVLTVGPTTIAASTTEWLEPTLAQHKLPTGLPWPRPAPPVLGDGGADSQRPSVPCSQTETTAAASRDDGGASPVKSIHQPAKTLHAVTFMSAGSSQKMRGQIGLGPAPSLERLRKPFKPLTINRPTNPH